MTYQIEYIAEVVRKDIPKLPHSMKPLIKRAIEERLTTDPVHYGKPLRYSLSGKRRLRVGDYRVVYEIEEVAKKVVIYAVKHRKDVYS